MFPVKIAREHSAYQRTAIYLKTWTGLLEDSCLRLYVAMKAVDSQQIMSDCDDNGLNR